MTFAAFEPRQTRLPAFAVAVLLHVVVIALLVLAPRPALPPIGSSVPVNVISDARATNSRPAVEAPSTETAATPRPTPEAPPQTPAPAPGPPLIAKAAPAPKAQPAPQPTASAAPRAAAPPSRPFDFNRLQQIIQNARRSSGVTSSSARSGPTTAETAPQARPNAGEGVSQSDLAGLEQLLERLWNPNCGVAGGASVKLKFRILVGIDGGLLEAKPLASGGADPAVVQAALLRAHDALQQAAPFSQPYWGQAIVVNFDAKEPCANR
jgi:protein TonB